MLNAESHAHESRVVTRLSALSRRAFRLPGRHTSETPSPTAPGWRTATAAPVPLVVVTPQACGNILLYDILLYIAMHKRHHFSSGVGKLERGKGTDIRIKLERPQDHQSSSVSL